jgi:hypothetical protein
VAAVVTVLSELALAIPFSVIVARHIGSSLLRIIGPYLIAGGGALTAFLVVEPPAGGLIGLASGLSAYGLVLLALRPIEPEERQVVAAYVGAFRDRLWGYRGSAQHEPGPKVAKL